MQYHVPHRISLFGVWIDSLTLDELHARLTLLITERKHALVLNVNAHCLNLAYKQPWLRSFLNTAEVVFADGYGVVLAARLWGYHIPTRITYADWTWHLAKLCAEKSFSIYLLGSQPGVAAIAAEKLQAHYPNISIVGTHHGYFNKTQGHAENEAVIRSINSVSPDIVLVGFGMPLQEKWLQENWDRIDARVALTGGAVFDYISGQLQRGPRWMTDNGLEWLARLLIEPERLWKRYILGNPLFLWRILLQRVGIKRFE